ncbi:hypothetical protein CVT25_009832 [Psilocybe cyanescens]|uniref:DAD domain-containing protein n=1 Tax=Psilocybe cyanescens TaxID=93625 RepID=A0A409X827_PSICY|nr:hypothetical protein CVT25_009832 [Psilocybe cyanescens]
MSRSQSHFSAKKDSIEETLRPYEPTKHIKRLYVPENVIDTDRVFSEYDWKNQTYTTTLRSIPQRPPAPIFPHVTVFDSAVASKNSGSQTARKETEVSISFPHIIPRHNSRSVPDETLISSYLLSSSPLSAIDDTSSRPYNYPLSPIYQSDSLSSPLEQSIMANAELDRESHHPQSPSARSAKQLRDNQPGRISFAKRPRSDSRKTMVDGDLPTTSSTQNMAPSRRNRSCTWSSDVTAVEVSEGGDKSFACEANYDEMDDEVSDYQSAEVWKVRQGEEIRRRSLRRRRPSVQSYPDFDDFEEVEEDQSAEEDLEGEETRKETRMNHIMSAIHYRYVSVGLRIQLAVYRTEKKVARKLSDRQRN